MPIFNTAAAASTSLTTAILLIEMSQRKRDEFQGGANNDSKELQ